MDYHDVFPPSSSSSSLNFGVEGGGSHRSSSRMSGSGGSSRSPGMGDSSSNRGPDVRSGFFMRRSTQDPSLMDDSMTITKLQFHRIPLFGRDKQIQALEASLEELFQYSVSSSSSSSENSPPAIHPFEGSKTKSSGCCCCRLLSLIRGNSGAGKTALALHGKRWIERKYPKYSIFVQGKFDLKQMDEPYAAIKASLLQFCENLRKDNPKQQQAIRHKIDKELEPELQSKLLQVIPELSALMSAVTTKTSSRAKKKNEQQRAAISDSSYKESSDLLKYAYRQFIQVLSDYMPLIFFIDDCQWIDKPSLELIRSWITDTNSNSSGRLLIIACYRSNEVTDEHILSSVITELRNYEKQQQQQQQKNQNHQNAVVRIWEIEVDGIDPNAINEMLVALMDQPPDKTMGLAQVVHQRTKGNVFFIRQFLETMTQQGLLSFHWGSCKWIWEDIDRIRTTLRAADNVADLLNDKLRRSKVGQTILPAAACLGCQFNKDILGIVLQKILSEDPQEGGRSSSCTTETDDDTIDQLLQQCQDEGFIEMMAGESTTDGGRGSNNYRFIHDKIQEASLNIIAREELDDYKCRVGGILLDESLVTEQGPMLFTAVNLLSSHKNTSNKTKKCTSSREKEKIFKIAKLNFAAGKKAMACSAFDDAATYLRQSIDLLEENHWTSQPDLSVEIFSLAALAENCCGNFGPMRAHCMAVLNQKHISILDKVVVYHALMDGAMAQFDIEQSILYGLELLSLLGLRFPQSSAVIKITGLYSLLRSKLAMNKKAVENIGSLPVTTDQRELAITKTLDKLCTGCFLKKPDGSTYE